MSLRTFVTLLAALGVLYGLAFLLVPELVQTTYGVKSTPATTLGYRYFGTALLGLGLMSWGMKDCSDRAALQNFLLATGIADGAGVIVSAYGAATGGLNVLGWFNVGLYAALLVGCVYFYRAAPALRLRTAA